MVAMRSAFPPRPYSRNTDGCAFLVLCYGFLAAQRGPRTTIAGAKTRTSHPALGNTGTDTEPASRSVSGICAAFRSCRKGKPTLTYFRSVHAERRDDKSSVSPASSALITTGRPSRVPVSRPAKISLGTCLCPACESSVCRAEPIRHAQLPGLCRWGF